MALAGIGAQFAGAETPRLPLAFSTLGCPKWTWPQILDFAEQHGFAAIELRGMLGEMNLPARPEFAADKIASAKRDVAAHGLKIACVSSSAEMHGRIRKNESSNLRMAGVLLIWPRRLGRRMCAFLATKSVDRGKKYSRAYPPACMNLANTPVRET